MLKIHPEKEEKAYDGRRSSMAVYLSLAVVLLLLTGGVFFWDRITAMLEPAPTPYVEVEHGDPLRLWMKEAFPRYLIEVSRPDGDHQGATEALLEASAFHAGLSRRTAPLTDAIGEFWTFSRSPLAQKDALRQRIDQINESAVGIQDMLDEIGAPYTIDHEVGAYETNGRWWLRFRATTSQIVQRMTYRTEGDVFEVWLLRRLDNLALRDLVHGKAYNGRALILEEQALEQVTHRYLCALGDGELRDFGEEPNGLSGEEASALLTAILPDGLRERADEIGVLARERRALLEDLDREMRRYNISLITPPAFFFEPSLLQPIRQRFASQKILALLDELEKFSTTTALDEGTVRAIEDASAALVERFVWGVGRHEAWHLLRPAPQAIEGAPRNAEVELIAYIGEIADADDELVLMFDQLLKQSASSALRNSGTRTGGAVRHIRASLIEPFLLERTEEPLQQRLDRVQDRARELRSAWFNEERALHLSQR